MLDRLNALESGQDVSEEAAAEPQTGATAQDDATAQQDDATALQDDATAQTDSDSTQGEPIGSDGTQGDPLTPQLGKLSTPSPDPSTSGRSRPSAAA